VTSSPTPSDNHFEPWEEQTARAAVRSFNTTHAGGIRGWDEDDLVQECLLQWWLRRDRYDSAMGASRRTFMNRVCENRLFDLVREAGADKRGGRRNDLSLEWESDGGWSLEEVIPDPRPADPESEAALAALRDQIRALRPRLTTRQWALVEDALRDFDIRETSSRLGVPRSTLYDELRRMRALFRDAGLEEFLR
jgi:RNA polymerase sigma-70 factor (ECF subfamily)